MAEGANLPGFDGALYRAPANKTGWGIVYNNALASRGRINFSLAHEFGHYLLHRADYPNGIRCGAQDVVRWDPAYGQIEHEANRFAANLLMRLDDFRRQIPAGAKVDLDVISHCADRYRVSLIAAILRWLIYTTRRAVLVVSRDDFMLWSRASDAALKTGAFFRTSGAPVEIPVASLAATQDQIVDRRTGVLHPRGVWFPEEVREMTIFSEQYDFTHNPTATGRSRPLHSTRGRPGGRHLRSVSNPQIARCSLRKIIHPFGEANASLKCAHQLVPPPSPRLTLRVPI
jgi:hypothetical protein